MKNKSRKYDRIMQKKNFTKQELLILKNYRYLLVYKIPYDLINRGYRRYIERLEDYLFEHNYPKWWFYKNKERFSMAVMTYIESKKENYTYNFYTHGWIAAEIVKLSELDKYIEI